MRVNYAEVVDESCAVFLHRHEVDYEILYCMSGIHKMIVNGKLFVLKEKEFLVVKPKSYHDFVYEPIVKKKVFIFAFNKLHCDIENKKGFITNALNYIDKKSYVFEKDKVGCTSAIHMFMRELEQKLPGYQQMLYNSFSEFMTGLFRNFIFTASDETIRSETNYNCDLNIALECTRYMHDHYHENIKIQDVADYFHVSERHINRVFEGYFGISFKKTLNELRINYAKNYLMNTNYSIEEISECVGLGSANVLYRLFKNSEGITPMEYRMQCR